MSWSAACFLIAAMNVFLVLTLVHLVVSFVAVAIFHVAQDLFPVGEPLSGFPLVRRGKPPPGCG